jgi:hypothetical protein
MFGGQWKKKEKHPFHLFSLSPQQILFKPFFPIDLKVYFTMVLGLYLHLSFLLLDL